jgi:hypothetical protein
MIRTPSGLAPRLVPTAKRKTGKTYPSGRGSKPKPIVRKG